MTSTTLTVAILGPGGVGGLIGGLLARDGHRVICLAGEETTAVLRRDGLRVRSARYGDFTDRCGSGSGRTGDRRGRALVLRPGPRDDEVLDAA